MVGAKSTHQTDGRVESRTISIKITRQTDGRMVLIFAGTYFRGDRNDRISRVYIIFADSPLKCCKNPQNCLKMTEFSKITFFAGTNFRELCQKPRNPEIS